MRVLVVDDEPLARDRLLRFIQSIDYVDGTAAATNGTEALKRLESETFDVVLLDIRMPGPSGIEVAESISKMPQRPAVIFCTAYDEHALEAFRVNAQSYLLKPIQKAALEEALQQCQKLNRAQVMALSTGESNSVPTIPVQTGREKERLPLAEVYYFRADQKYVSLFGERGERVVDISLKALEEKFASLLIRVHRNCLVNRSRIEKLFRDSDGGYWVSVQGEEKPLAVSRRHVKQVKEIFSEQAG
ncbi:LytR/AlgR family response regulator transcription factor [Reinekea marinisedimentorum]|uniref:Two-component system response regulator AlgR n=1 Tax=Reinekea marinisedimentorum TaxID=230495 RepID=A0A4R3HZD3_9GAMM|nr:LytTR family DNA-binding domain-containing protein [Reinekea marinisedimentorum]TCS38244.1 two-component system response regulator AlgR [Reinekea marinisedimentorum]